MALILNIDTAFDIGYVTLAENGEILLSAHSDSHKNHAAWIQAAVYDLMKEADLPIQKLNAVGANIGPGSYTGLRIGLSTAKGICYALNIPLITQSSLKVMALSAIKYIETSDGDPLMQELLYCPMIDARRMEVFTAIYDSNLHEIMKARAFILNSASFNEHLKRQKILFWGNGSIKFQSVCQNQNAVFEKIPLNPVALTELTYKNFIGNNFADLVYIEPFYIKEFFTKPT
jgi:tRNA threonylcarbamoyladenosine biosynthesis protein TsaB